MQGLLLWIHRDGEPDTYRLTLFFTAFVLVQFWNLFNVRGFGTHRPGFAGLTANPWFLLVAGVILAGQVAIVQFGGAAFRTVPLSLADWAWLLAGTAPTLLLGPFLHTSPRDDHHGHNPVATHS